MRTPSLALILLGAVACHAAPAVDPAVAEVAAHARAFLASLPAPLTTQATRPFDDAERTRWAFVPGRYPGVAFADLDPAQSERAQALLRTLLSPRGLQKTLAIVQLENVLRVLEGKDGRDVSHRDPGRYTLLLCGTPGTDAPFAVRLQGHHVSLHFTFFGGWLVGCTPHFLGSNPHERRDAPHVGERVLTDEEELARELLASLDAAQQTRAIVAATAPPDVLLGPAAAFDTLGAPQGLPATAMDAAQQERLWRLVTLFAHNLRGEFADAELQRLQGQRFELVFAWAGGQRRGEGHYWRVHGRTFVLEYDNTQNDANHVHVVWRDRERDFGVDPLREHLRQHAAHR